MRGRGLTFTVIVVGLVGLVLLLVESIQAMRGVIIGTIGTTLLFLGVGLIGIAAVVVGLVVSSRPDD